MLSSKTNNSHIAEFNALSLDEAVSFICSKNAAANNGAKIYLNIKTEEYPRNIIMELTQDALQVGIEVRPYSKLSVYK
ncbi:MAG: hypothetical protein ACJAWL_000840 [Motiliproteus sp.]|jgi:hypothetical protein